MMPEIRKTHEHWYNFVVPEQQVTHFLARVLDTAQVGIQEETGRYSIDILYHTLGPERPAFISELLEEFDGVNVRRAMKREKLTVLSPNAHQ